MSNILVLSIAISYEDAPLKHIQSFHLKSFHHGQTFKICNNQSEFRELWPESSCSKTLFLLINELSLCKVKQTMWVLMVMSQDHRWKGALIVLTSFLLLKSNKMINLSSHYLTNSRNEKKKKKISAKLLVNCAFFPRWDSLVSITYSKYHLYSTNLVLKTQTRTNPFSLLNLAELST